MPGRDFSGYRMLINWGKPQPLPDAPVYGATRQTVANARASLPSGRSRPSCPSGFLSRSLAAAHAIRSGEAGRAPGLRHRRSTPVWRAAGAAPPYELLAHSPRTPPLRSAALDTDPHYVAPCVDAARMPPVEQASPSLTFPAWWSRPWR